MKKFDLSSHGRFVFLVLSALAAAACPGDPPTDTATDTSTTSDPGTTGTTAGTTETTTGTGTTEDTEDTLDCIASDTDVTAGETGGPECDPEVSEDFPFVSGVDMLDDVPNLMVPAMHCPEGILDEGVFEDPMGETWELFIRRPAIDMNATWPDTPLPIVVFSHGQGHNGELYAHLFDPLAQQGFLVVSVYRKNFHFFTFKKRVAQMLCTTHWLRSVWSQAPERVGCNLVWMGHSDGGHAALEAAILRGEGVNGDTTTMLDLAALVTIAPGTPNNLLRQPSAAPLLAIQGSRDAQTSGSVQRAFDLVAPETNVHSETGKYVIWSLDVDHDAFGGKSTPPPEHADGVPPDDMVAKGRAIAAEYIVPFLRWQVLAEDPAGIRPLFVGEQIPATLGLPENEIWWEHLAGYSGEPLLRFKNSIDTSESAARLIVDTMDRCDGIPFVAQPSGVTVELGFSSVENGPGTSLALAVTPDWAMSVKWNQDNNGVIRWKIGEIDGLDLGDYDHLSFRVANILEDAEKVGDDACEPVGVHEDVSITVGLADIDGASVSVTIEPIAAQDFGLATFGGAKDCHFANFSHTVRIPIRDLCTGLDLQQIDHVFMRFSPPPDPDKEYHVLLDGLEFTRSPFFDDAGLCGA